MHVLRWDLEPSPTADNPDVSGTFTVYLWGFVLVFAIAVAIGGWAYGKAKETRETLWGYFVVAMLWPLFVCAVLFVVLWSILSRNRRDT